MKNADKIRSFTDEQLGYFLWNWGINATTSYMECMCQNLMNIKEVQKWLQSEEGFICVETKVDEGFTFNQDFKKKTWAEYDRSGTSAKVDRTAE